MVAGNTSLALVLRWLQRGLFTVAILMLVYCGVALGDAWIFQHQSAAALGPVPAVVPDGLAGRLEIQRLGISVLVVEGTGQTELRRAVGHIIGTALPGRPGNVGIAGHRDMFFRPLRKIQPGDMITLTTARGEYRYRVAYAKVVSPYDVTVLNPDGDEILTLVTCYPFYFVGSAPDRFIVRAARVL
jgi:sortase A